MKRHVLAAASALALAACSPSPIPTSRGVPLLISWDGPDTAAAIEMTVSAPDLPVPIALRLAADSGPATIHVPPGANRTFAAHAVDALGWTSHSGTMTVTVDGAHAHALRIPLRRGPRVAFTVHVDPPDPLPSANPELALSR